MAVGFPTVFRISEKYLFLYFKRNLYLCILKNNKMDKDRFLISKTNGVFKGTRVITDKKTGVQYLFVWDSYAGGLTLLVDKDGKPLIEDTEKSDESPFDK